MEQRTARLAEIAALIGAHAAEDREYATAIGNLYFNRRSTPGQPLYAAQWPCFALVAQGAKSLAVGNSTLRYGVGDFLLVSLDLPVVSRVTEASAGKPLLSLGLAIDGARMAELMGRIDPATGGLPLRGAADAGLGVAVNRISDDLLDAVIRLLRLLDRPAHIAALAPLIEQEILYQLLIGPCGPQLIEISMADSSRNRIARSIAWLRAHYREPLRLESLADHAGMSLSSLHAHFKAATALTPLQYQKQLRLHEARRLMLHEELDVGSAGYRVGYQSASQFSREYGRLYGLPPQRDVERLRAQSA